MTAVHYQSPHTLSRWVLVLLGVMIGLDVMHAAQSVMQLEQLDQWNAGVISRAELEESGNLQGSLALLYLAAYLVTAVVFLMWFHRLWSNVHWMAQQWGVRHTLKYSTAWAVWSFIVPFVSFVRPYQIMRDAWDYNAPDDERGRHDILMGWWALWIAANVLGQVTMRVSDPGTVIDLQLVSAFVNIAAGGLVMLIVRRQTRYQVERVMRGHPSADVFS